MNVNNIMHPSQPQKKLNQPSDSNLDEGTPSVGASEIEIVMMGGADQVSETLKTPSPPDEAIIDKDKALVMMETFKKNAQGHLAQTMAVHSKQALHEAMQVLG